MALRIQKRSWKNQDNSITISWRLIVEDYTGNKRHCLYPDRLHYQRYGFNPLDTYEQAVEKLKIIQAQHKIARDHERRVKIDKRIRAELQKESAFLPKKMYADYLEWLCARRSWDQIPAKTESHLLCMRRLILDLNMDPSQWPRLPAKIHSWFQKECYSVSYLEKVLPLLNEYGYFYCQEMGKPYLEIPYPKGRQLQKIHDSNYDNRKGRTKASLPLRPEHLDAFKHLPKSKQRWLRLSLYFGLRPNEVDRLIKANEGSKWEVLNDDKGTPILKVYQSKLENLPRNMRYKHIPALLPEQKKLLREIMAHKPIKRTIAKTMQKNLGEGYGLYAGRKGFDGLMKSIGQQRINIISWKGDRDFREFDNKRREDQDVQYDPSDAKQRSKWFGHQSLNRTQHSYREQGVVDYDQIVMMSKKNRPAKVMMHDSEE